jgi:transposase
MENTPEVAPKTDSRKTRNADLKQVAYTLFLQGSKTLIEIAEITGVSEKTIRNWKEKYKWDDLKVAENSTQDLIVNYLNKAMLELMQENEGKGTITNIKEISRLTVIKEKHSSKLPLAIYFAVFKDFNEYLKNIGELSLAKQFNTFQNSFIQNKIS